MVSGPNVPSPGEAAPDPETPVPMGLATPFTPVAVEVHGGHGPSAETEGYEVLGQAGQSTVRALLQVLLRQGFLQLKPMRHRALRVSQSLPNVRGFVV